LFAHGSASVVAVIVPPWWGESAKTEIATQGGLVLLERRNAVTFIGYAPGGADTARLRRAGALLVLSAESSALCRSNPSPISPLNRSEV
jgi:hypothetical protein